jgi:hypothetical protein
MKSLRAFFTLICISCVLLLGSLTVLGQQEIHISHKQGDLLKVWIAKSLSGMTFVGYRHSEGPLADDTYQVDRKYSLNIQVIDTSGAELNAFLLPPNLQIIGTASGDSTVTFYAVEEKKGLSFKRIVLGAKAEPINEEELLHLSKDETVVSMCEIEGVLAIISIDKERLLRVHVLKEQAELLCRLPLKEKDIATQIRKRGAVAVSSDQQLTTMFQNKEPTSIYYQNSLLYLVLDVPIYERPTTLVEIVDIAAQTSTVHYYNEKRKQRQSHSYIVDHHLYRLIKEGRDMVLECYSLQDQKLLGSYNINTLAQSTTLPLLTRKNYHKQNASSRIVENFKKETRFFNYGQAALIALPLPNGGIQLNAGMYYEDNTGIAPGTMGMFGMMLFATTTTARTIHDNGKGTENYISLNFDGPGLQITTDLKGKSLLNRVDDHYIDLVTKHPKLRYFDYQLIEGVPSIVYSFKNDEKLYIEPVKGSTSITMGL